MKRVRWSTVILGSIIAASVLVRPSFLAALPDLCPFHRFTGRMCPGCGLTRSFVETAHFDFTPAFAHHPFGPLAFLACLVLLFFAFVNGAPPKFNALPVALRVCALLGATAWMAFGAARAIG